MKNNVKNKNIKKNSIYITIAVMLFLLSVMVTAQVKMISQTDTVQKLKRENELLSDITALKKDYEELERAYEEKSKIVDEYKNASSGNSQLISSMKDEIETLSIIAGTKDVQGEGIVINLDDSKIKPTNSINDSLFIVHDADLQMIVNELKAAGAEAININGERIITTSAIRCVGPVIQVNSQKIAPPFIIKAIGNAQYLESALNLKGGISDQLKENDLNFQIKREKNVVIEKYKYPITNKYAKELENN